MTTVHNELPERTREGGLLKSVGIALLVPFIVLAFVVAFPLIGLAVFAKHAIQTAFERRGGIAIWARNAALFFAAPFFALFYIALLPVVLASMLVSALRRRRVSHPPPVGRVTEKR